MYTLTLLFCILFGIVYLLGSNSLADRIIGIGIIVSSFASPINEVVAIIGLVILLLLVVHIVVQSARIAFTKDYD